MTRKTSSKDRDHLLTVVVGVVAIAALYFARVILIPLALALLLSFILTPLAHLLERARLGRVFPAVFVVFLAVAVVAGVGWTFGKQFASVIEELPDYQENITHKIQTLRGAQSHALSKAADTVNKVSQQLVAAPSDSTLEPTEGRAKPKPAKQPLPVEVVKPPSLPLDSVQGVLGVLTSFGLVVIFTLFMIMRRDDLRNRFISLIGTGHLHVATQAMDDAAARVSRYLRLQLVVNSCYGAIIGIGLHFIGLPGALLWGVIAGILRFVPYLGPPLGGIGPLLLAIAIFPEWHGALWTLGLFVATEITTSQLAEPMLYGERTGLSPVAVLVAAVFWTAIWGPIGLVLSTPLTVCLVVLGRRVPRLAFLHTLLSDDPVLTPTAHFYQRLLAMDSREARDVLEAKLKTHPLEELYEAVVLPALAMAEQDRHSDQLDDATEKFIVQNTKEFVEDLYQTANHHPTDRAAEGTEAMSGQEVRPNLHVVCIPARDEADEIVAIMLAQILQRAGHRADAIPIGTTSDMLAEISHLNPDIVCISALPPFAISHARLLYNRLRTQSPQLKIILGLWNSLDDLRVVVSRMGMTEEGSILTSLSQVVRTIATASEVATANSH
jgi:predicted PurR-regulated permease PerM